MRLQGDSGLAMLCICCFAGEGALCIAGVSVEPGFLFSRVKCFDALQMAAAKFNRWRWTNFPSWRCAPPDDT